MKEYQKYQAPICYQKKTFYIVPTDIGARSNNHTVQYELTTGNNGKEIDQVMIQGQKKCSLHHGKSSSRLSLYKYYAKTNFDTVCVDAKQSFQLQ